MTVKVRLLYSYRNSGFGFRHASEYVPDPRDLDVNGQPPAWFLPHDPVVAEPDEVEFDHEPTAAELAAAFPQSKEAKDGKSD